MALSLSLSVCLSLSLSLSLCLSHTHTHTHTHTPAPTTTHTHTLSHTQKHSLTFPPQGAGDLHRHHAIDNDLRTIEPNRLHGGVDLQHLRQSSGAGVANIIP